MRQVKKLLRLVARPSLLGCLIRHRVAAGVEHGQVLAQLDGCATIVDVGAHRGQFALAARHWHRSASIEAFEPLPEPARLFRKVLGRDGNVRLHQVAVGPAKGRATIHLSARDDCSSLLPLTTRQLEVYPGTHETGTATIEIGPLHEFIDAQQITQPALLKIDAQGYELQVLEGCTTAMNRFAWIYVECSFMELYEGQALAHEVVAWLARRDYSLQGVYNMQYTAQGRAIQGDFLFTR